MKLIFCINICLLSVFSFGQTNTDSLLKIWQNQKNGDSVRAEALYLYTSEKANLNNDSGIIYSRKLAHFSHRKQLKKYEALAANLLGGGYTKNGNVDSALIFLDSAFVIFSRQKNYKMMGGSIINMGIIKYFIGELADAFLDLNKGIEYCNLANEKSFAARAYLALGNVCSKIDEDKKAIYYFKNSLKIGRAIGDSNNIVYALGSLAALHEENDNIDKAFYLLKQQLHAANKLKQSFAQSMGHINFASGFIKLGKTDSAWVHLEKVKSLMQNMGSTQLDVAFENYTGKYYLQTRDWQKALHHCNKGWELNKHFELFDQNIELCECQYKAYKELGDLENALIYHEFILSLQDSIKKEDIASEIQRAELKRKLTADSLMNIEALRIQKAEEEKIAAAKTRKNRIQYSLVIIVVLLLATVIAVATKFKISPRLASGLIFIFFILTFEFLLVVLDPWVDSVSNGEVGWKIAINTAIALLLFGIHQASEKRLKNAILKVDR